MGYLQNGLKSVHPLKTSLNVKRRPGAVSKAYELKSAVAWSNMKHGGVSSYSSKNDFHGRDFHGMVHVDSRVWISAQ